MLKSLCIAFATYSRIPVPRVEWNDRNMRYALCAFPLVGLAAGLVMALWVWLSVFLGLPNLLLAAGLLITFKAKPRGGIRLPGDK